jgi:hypothetical protein
MRVVRNIVNNNRTIVCTIHQPSAEIFLHFDELLLLKRGGRTIFYGEMGEKSADLVRYFESVDGAKRLQSGYNPATYMLEVRVPGLRLCSSRVTERVVCLWYLRAYVPWSHAPPCTAMHRHAPTCSRCGPLTFRAFRVICNASSVSVT